MPIPDLPISELSQWTLVLGAMLPPVVSVVTQSHWPSRVKAWTAAGVCFTASVVTLGLMGRLSLHNLPSLFLAVVAMATLFYRNFWKQAGTVQIEAATDLKPKAGVKTGKGGKKS